MTKNTPTMIAAVVPDAAIATSTQKTAAIVAPASGMRSSSATSSPRATAYGTPVIQNTIPDATPAIRLISRFPVT